MLPDTKDIQPDLFGQLGFFHELAHARRRRRRARARRVGGRLGEGVQSKLHAQPAVGSSGSVSPRAGKFRKRSSRTPGRGFVGAERRNADLEGRSGGKGRLCFGAPGPARKRVRSSGDLIDAERAEEERRTQRWGAVPHDEEASLQAPKDSGSCGWRGRCADSRCSTRRAVRRVISVRLRALRAHSVHGPASRTPVWRNEAIRQVPRRSARSAFRRSTRRQTSLIGRDPPRLDRADIRSDNRPASKGLIACPRYA
jgi:hypothetical protein